MSYFAGRWGTELKNFVTQLPGLCEVRGCQPWLHPRVPWGAFKMLMPGSLHLVSLGHPWALRSCFLKLSGDHDEQLSLRTTGLERSPNPAIWATEMMRIDRRWRGMSLLGVVFGLLLPNDMLHCLGALTLKRHVLHWLFFSQTSFGCHGAKSWLGGALLFSHRQLGTELETEARSSPAPWSEPELNG